MDDLQATIEIAVDLGKFYNVDLFQRGFYRVAVRLTEPVHPQAKLEVHVLKSEDKDYFCPARTLDDGLGAVSKCLQVLYKREEGHLNHTFLFRVHCLLDSQRIIECLKKFSFQLEATLRFSSADDLPDDLASMEEVSKRTLKLELDLIYGLFASTLILFDYGYMAAVEFSVHASLVALHQPLMTMPGILPTGKSGMGNEPATLESILFRALPGMSLGQSLSPDIKLSNAISVHAKLIKILLTVYAHMQNYYLSLLRSLPSRHREGYVLSNLQQVSSRLYNRGFKADVDSLAIDPVDVAHKLSDMTLALKELRSLEEVVNQVNMNLASTCSLLLALWSHVLDTSCLNKQVRKQLGFKYHKQRVQRFQCGFFTTENPRSASFDDNRYGVYNWMANEIRSSRYFTELPVLPIHNEEADGNLDSLPIIFEDVFTHQCKSEPTFRSRSVLSLFSRTSSSPAVASKNTQLSQNGFANVTEEMGHEERILESPNSSISSCGEACENTVLNGKEDGTGHKKMKTKYSKIFRKRKGSYKPNRMERLSVSDDESTKVTLAEFLSSIETKKSLRSVRSKSFITSSSTTAPTKTKPHRKLKVSLSANDQHPSKRQKSKKRGSFSQHRRSLDEGAQRLLQLVRIGKRSSDSIDQIVDEKSLSRSFSSSVLDDNKTDSSTASSHTSLDHFDQAMKDGEVSDATLLPAPFPAATANQSSIRRGFATAVSRNAENRFRAQLRSETSEEPESGITQKTIAMSANNSMIKVTATVVSKKPSPTPPTKSSITTTPEKYTSQSHDLKPNHIFHGMIKSQSYSTGIERLQNGTDETDQFPRPHAHATVSCGSRMKTSHTTLGGLDRVRYGMGLHPGGSTITTTDLSPFDEPELIQAWGELSTSSPVTKELSPSSSDDAELSANKSLHTSDDDTLTQNDLSYPNVNGIELSSPVNNQEDLTLEGSSQLGELSKVQSTPSDGSVVKETDVSIRPCPPRESPRTFENVTQGIVQNGSSDGMGRVGEFFFPDPDEELDFQGIQGSTLPADELLLSIQRTHSMRVLAGSLECSEDPSLIKLEEELRSENETEQVLRDLVFEPSPKLFLELEKKEVNHNRPAAQSSKVTSVASNTSSTVKKHHANTSIKPSKSKFPNNDKLSRTLGDVSSTEAEASLATSVELFNSIPPMRTQRERRHVAEKSRLFGRLHFPGFSYADIPPTMPMSPYLSVRLSLSRCHNDSEESHLVVCVHGLDGNSNDLRLVRTYIQLAVPASSNLSFLMARSNQEDTYANIDTMTERLVSEIIDYLQHNYVSGRLPGKISFVGHSLGCLLIRSVVAHDRMRHLRSRFHTFLSFSGPHLGTIFNNSALVNTGLWLIQKWKKSACLLQLACKDHADLRKTYVYKLSKKKGLEFFRNILLVASAADRYVPYHSARIEMCKQAFRDKTMGPPYQEMLNNIMKPVLNKQKLNLVRYHVVHSLPSANANTMIGRAAHIAVLDSDVFLEKFILVSAIRYFA